MTNRVDLGNFGHYHVVSIGNGWAYEVSSKKLGRDWFFQDEDAAALFRECLNHGDVEANLDVWLA
jgi:hypothetical protein